MEIVKIKTGFVEELKERGMFNDISSNRDINSNDKIYIGFDPTAKSIHLGNLVTSQMLKIAHKHGIEAFAVVGGATAMIGDPSGKNSERSMLSTETILDNKSHIIEQLSKFLGDDIRVLDNLSWTKNINILDFLRDIGKHGNVNVMLRRDSVANRLENGISFTEFTYQLLQAFDFLHLFKTHGVTIQSGASDQWGNIHAGIELIERWCRDENNKSALTDKILDLLENNHPIALTGNLLLKSDGTKFGKSETGTIWLDKNLTKPFELFNFLLNTTDGEAERMILIFHESVSEAKEIIAKHKLSLNDKLLQHTVANIIVELVHSKEELDLCNNIANLLFHSKEPLSFKDKRNILMDNIPTSSVTLNDDDKEIKVIDLINESGCTLFSSKSDIRRNITGGSVFLNRFKVTDDKISTTVTVGDILHVQCGKKKHALIQVL